jgi:hypothetical protein
LSFSSIASPDVRFVAAIRSRQRSPGGLFSFTVCRKHRTPFEDSLLIRKFGLPSKEYNLLQISVSEQKIIV